MGRKVMRTDFKHVWIHLKNKISLFSIGSKYTVVVSKFLKIFRISVDL